MVVYQVPVEAGLFPPFSGFSSQGRIAMLLMRRRGAGTVFASEPSQMLDPSPGTSTRNKWPGPIRRDWGSTQEEEEAAGGKLEAFQRKHAPPSMRTDDECTGHALSPRVLPGFAKPEGPGGTEGKLSYGEVAPKELAVVTSGIVGPSTMVAFRAKGQEFVTLIQLSQEVRLCSIVGAAEANRG